MREWGLFAASRCNSNFRGALILTLAEFYILMNLNSQSPRPIPNFSSILKEASSGRANLINIFGDSFAASLAIFFARVRRFTRNQHLDIKLPLLLLVITFLGVSWLMFQSSYSINYGIDSATRPGRLTAPKGGFPLNNYTLLKDVGTLFGATITIFFAMSNMHREYHYKKRDKASAYVSVWHSKESMEIRNAVTALKDETFWNQHSVDFDLSSFNQCHSILADYKKSANGVEILQKMQSEILKKLYANTKDAKNLRDQVDLLLSLFEHMGLDVKERVVDSEYLKDYFYAVVVDNYEFFRKYIEYKQIRNSSRIACCNLVYLAQTWEKEGCTPELPRISLRPPIITSEDLKSVYDHKK